MAIKFNPDFAHFDPTSSAKPVLGSAARTYGRRRTISKVFEVTAADMNTGNVIVLCPIPSSAVLHELYIANDDMEVTTTALLVDLGLCDNQGADINPGAGDSRELLSNASVAFQAPVLPSTFHVAGINYAYHSATAAQDVREAVGAQMWERVNLQTAAAFAADPSALWFLSVRIQLQATTPIPGTLAFEASYTLD